MERELGRQMTDWQRTKHGRARVGVNKDSKWREAIASGRFVTLMCAGAAAHALASVIPPRDVRFFRLQLWDVACTRDPLGGGGPPSVVRLPF